MTAGILLLNFGEPPTPERDVVVDYLTRIFYNNADLEQHANREAALERSRELAERRASGLMEEYREIGGSPLNPQAEEQAEALAEELRERGRDVRTWVGMQFMEPTVADAAATAREADVDRLVGFPVYPLCGQSTTVAALEDLDRALDEMGWSPSRADLTGWHRHPDYVSYRAENVRRFCEGEGVDLSDPGTRLVLSAHGTPRKYLDEGNRYEEYVEEYVRALAGKLDVEDPVLGYQNHGNRSEVAWTEPDVEDAVTSLDAERVVVEPVSFVHEQSETLSELDVELREEAEEAGLELHRVPVPHAEPRFIRLLADLVEPLLEADVPEDGADFEGRRFLYGACRCKPTDGTFCLNSVEQPDREPATA